MSRGFCGQCGEPYDDQFGPHSCKGVEPMTITIAHRPWQSATTEYLGPTDTKPARIKARTVSGRSCTVNWNYELDTYGNHAAAAYELFAHLGWKGDWVSGSIPDGYVFVRSK